MCRPQEFGMSETPSTRSFTQLPDDERDLLKQMVFEQRETNRKLEKIERELLGEEGSRENGLVFRLAKAEERIQIGVWVIGSIALAVIGLIVTKLASVMEGK
jgi:hypothetical protein